MSKPKVILKFSKLVGLDPTKLQFEWEPVADKASESVLSSDGEKRLLSTLRESSGIVLDKVSTKINIDTEAMKWRIEFGDEMGRRMERAVRKAMPDYEYMKERRLRA